MRYLTLLVSLCAFLFASFPAAAGVDVVIAAGGTESSVIDIHTIAAGGGAFLAIYTPSAWTTAGLSFKVSPNGRNRWSPAYDVKGTEYTVTKG